MPGADLGDAPSGAGLPARGRTIGRYQVLAEIARGGMGAVYRVHDPVLRRDAALKVLLSEGTARPEAVERFLREARAMSRLYHPNMVSILEVGFEQGQPFLVMELLEGGSLKDLIQRRGKLPVREALALVERLAMAIEYAHSLSILHRDLKPANVLLDRDGTPKVTDLGIARDFSGQEDKPLTLGGQIMGTPAYMPPEQAAAERERMGTWSDVYSLGAILYELIGGQPPFQAPSLMALLRLVLEAPPEPLRSLRPDVPAEVELIVQKAMAKEPGARYQRAGELAADLRAVLAGEPPSVRRVPALERVARWVARRRAAAGAASLALLVAAGGAAALLRQRHAQRELLVSERLNQVLDLVARGDPAALESARVGLEAALEDAPAHPRAQLLVARLILDSPRAEQDLARARRAWERSLPPGFDPDRPATTMDGELARVTGRVAELEGQPARARAAYERAVELGERTSGLAGRLAHLVAVEADARGWPAEAERARWVELAEAPEDARPLAAILERQVRSDDVEALLLGWDEIHRRLRPEDRPALQEVTAADRDLVLRELSVTAPLRLRVCAALTMLPFAGSEPVRQLEAFLAPSTPELLRGAAGASLLALSKTTFAEWAAQAVAPGETGAAACATLFEHAPHLRAEDLPACERLGGPDRPALLRAAVPLALACAASRASGLSTEAALEVLERLQASPEAPELARARARTSAHALRILTGRARGPHEAEDLLLATALLRVEEPPPARVAREAVREAVTRAAESTEDGALLLLSAWQQFEHAGMGAPSGPLEALLVRALRAGGGAPAVRVRAHDLLAQLHLLGRAQAPPGLDLTDPDPEEARRAAERLRFADRFRLPALPGPAGMLRIVARELPDRAFEVLTGERRTLDGALATRRVTVVGSLFQCETWLAVRCDVAISPEEEGHGFTVRLHSDGSARVGLSLACRLGRVGHGNELALDGEQVGRAPRSPFPADRRASIAGGMVRRRMGFHLNGEPILLRSAVPRYSRGRGACVIEWGWSPYQNALTSLVVVGRWDEAAPARPAPPPPPPACLAGLRPLSQDLPVEAENLPPGTPRRLSALRSDPLTLEARQGWVGSSRSAPVLFLPARFGDVEVRARLVAPRLTQEAQAGVALRRANGDVVRLGLRAGERKYGPAPRVWLRYQRGTDWEKPLGGLEWRDGQDLVLSLARVGEYVVAQVGESADTLRPLDLGGEGRPAPLYFPFDGAVEPCVYASNYNEDRGPTVTFDEIDVRARE